MAPLNGSSSDPKIPAVIGENDAATTVAGDPTSGGRGVVGNSASGIGVLGQSPGGVAVYGNSGSNVGVYGESGQFQGVYGHSLGSRQTGGAGVVGESQNFDGVFGISHDAGSTPGVSGAGVSGHNDKGGFAGFFTGKVMVTGTVTAQDVFLSGADCAEQFDVVGPQPLDPGTVVVIDQEGGLRESREAYDAKVAGVVSGAGKYKPGIVLDGSESPGNRAAVAMVGKVYCKADAQYAPIRVGDRLTTSPTSGHAMKATDPSRALGSVLGKAMCGLQAGQGLIPILVALQ